jgi:colicin import membrane protein
MATAAVERDNLMPRSADGVKPGFALAALVHVGLLIAIAFGVSWKASEPEGVEAELWAAVPQVAAQRAVEPEPPAPVPKPVPKVEPKPEPAPPPPKVNTPDPQIAIEKEKQQKLKEKQKREDELEKAEKEKADKKKLVEDKAKLAKADADKKKAEEQLNAQREANIKRILGDANATGNSAGTAARTAGPSAAYAGRIKARIKPNILLTDTVDGNPLAEVEVRCSPDGTIISSKLIKSSGVKEWDDAVLRAIEKTEILPRDTDGTMPSPMVIAFRPRDF